MGESVQCCTDETCCAYSISCCGSNCGFSSEGCLDAIKAVFSCIYENISELVASEE